MMRNRMFKGEPVERLIVSVEVATVRAIDEHLKAKRKARNRSEFVRLAIEEKLRRDGAKFDD